MEGIYICACGRCIDILRTYVGFTCMLCEVYGVHVLIVCICVREQNEQLNSTGYSNTSPKTFNPEPETLNLTLP